MSDTATNYSQDSPVESNTKTPARAVFSVGSIEFTTRRLISSGLTLLVLIVLVFLWRKIGIEELHDRAAALPGVGVITAMILAPLLGFPVSWLHLIAGVRFGFIGGLSVVAFAGFCHHLLGHIIVRLLPPRYFSHLQSWRETLQGADHRDAAILCALLPGMPYTVQLYLLPIIGVPLRILFLISVPIHTVRAVVTIFLGNFGTELTPTRIGILVGYYSVLLVISAVAVRRLRRTIRHSRSQV